MDNNGKVVTTKANNLDDVFVIIGEKLGKEIDDATRERAKIPVKT